MIIAVSRKCSRKCICNNIPIYKRGTSLGTPEVSHFLKQSPLCSSTKEQLKCFTSSRSVKLILWRSFSSSAWSGTDICVVYLMCAKEWELRALLRPAPGVDSGEISLVMRLSTTLADSFFLFFSEDRLAFFCCIPQACRWENRRLIIMYMFIHDCTCYCT